MTQAKPVPLWRRLLGTFGWLFFLLMLLLWWFTSSLQPNLPIGSPQIEPRPGVDDVWLVLLPSLIPALLIGMGVVLTILRGALATDGTAPGGDRQAWIDLGENSFGSCHDRDFRQR